MPICDSIRAIRWMRANSVFYTNYDKSQMALIIITSALIRCNCLTIGCWQICISRRHCKNPDILKIYWLLVGIGFLRKNEQIKTKTINADKIHLCSCFYLQPVIEAFLYQMLLLILCLYRGTSMVSGHPEQHIDSDPPWHKHILCKKSSPRIKKNYKCYYFI